MDTTSADLEALARATAAGDSHAVNDLLAALRPEALRLCARFLPYREDAEEACQDTLLAVAQGIGRFDGRASGRTWFYRVAANRSRTTYQKLRRRWEGEASGVPLPEQADPRRTSVVAGIRLELLEALQALAPDHAEALVLRDVLDLPYAEIAALLEVPEGTVKSRIHEARRQVRRRAPAA